MFCVPWQKYKTFSQNACGSYRNNLILLYLVLMFKDLRIMRLLATTLVLLSLLSSCGSDKEDMCLFPLKGAENVNPDTRLVLTFNEVPVVGDSGMIRVFDAVSGEQVDSLDMSVPAGPTERRTYGPECDYTKVPYDYSRTVMPTNRNTRPGTPSGTAEPTPPDYQLNIIGGFTDAFHFYPIIVKDLPSQ